LIKVPVGAPLRSTQVPKSAPDRQVDQISMARSNSLTRTASALLQTANLGHSDHQNRHSQKAHRNLLRNQNSISTRATRVFVLRIVTVQPRKTKITQLAFVAWGRPIAGRPPFATDPVGRILKVIVDRWASLCNFGTKCEGLCNA